MEYALLNGTAKKLNLPNGDLHLFAFTKPTLRIIPFLSAAAKTATVTAHWQDRSVYCTRTRLPSPDQKPAVTRKFPHVVRLGRNLGQMSGSGQYF
jgi:hypothetical protein